MSCVIILLEAFKLNHHFFVEGVGGAIIEFTSTDMIAIYTEKYKDKMYAALVLAFSIGMSVTPSLMEYLISVTSYQTALIILAMPNLLSFPIALVYRGRCNADMCATKKDDNSDSAVPVCPERKLSEDNPAFEHISEVAVECENNSTSEESGIDVDYVDHRSADSKDGEYEQNTTINDMNDVTIIKQNTSSENNDTDQPGIEKRSVLSSHLFVFKDTAFILYLVYNMFAAAGEFSFHAFAVDYSVSLNILTLTEAALGMTLTSVSLCAAAIFMTVLSHWKLDRIAINVFVVLFMGISVVCVSLSNSQAAMYTCFIIFGFTEGVYISNLTSYVASGFEHSQYMIIRLSYVFVVTGIGALVGPIIAGHFAKTFGMKYLFFFLGALPLSAFFILLPYWLYKKLRQCSSHGKKETIEVQECRN